jgi:GntR family transcriptional regulator
VEPSFSVTVERGARPLHVEIAEQLTAGIAAGTLPPGTRLPPERELAESLGVSRMTVRQALGDLERDGLLRRVVGRAGGTVVREPQQAAAAPDAPGATSLAVVLRRQGGASAVEPISAVIEPAGKRTAAALDIRRSDPVVVITRLRLAGGKPLAVERSSFPACLFPDLENMDLGGSLAVLMDGFGLRPVRSIERLELTMARPADVRALGVRRDGHLLLLERIRFAADGTPVEFARDRFRPDRTRIVLESAEATDEL